MTYAAASAITNALEKSAGTAKMKRQAITPLAIVARAIVDAFQIAEGHLNVPAPL